MWCKLEALWKNNFSYIYSINNDFNIKLIMINVINWPEYRQAEYQLNFLSIHQEEEEGTLEERELTRIQISRISAKFLVYPPRRRRRRYIGREREREKSLEGQTESRSWNTPDQLNICWLWRLMEPGSLVRHSPGLSNKTSPEANQTNSSYWYVFL